MKQLLIFSILIISCNSNKDVATIPTKTIGLNEKLIEKNKEGAFLPEGELLNSDSTMLKLSEIQGNNLVLDFWATWCQPCLVDAPIIDSLADVYKDQNVDFISISIDESFSDWKSSIQKRNLEGHQYWLGDKKDTDLFSLTYAKEMYNGQEVTAISLPRYILVSPNGEIIDRNFGRPNKPEFQIKLDSILNLAN